LEAGTVSDKVTISYRGAKYEIGRGKRYYGIWVAGAPMSDPIDRWPLTSEGWTQAWARFTAIETPGTISGVEKPRAGFQLPRLKRPGPGPRPGPRPAGGPDPGSGAGFASSVAALRSGPSRGGLAAGLLGLGLLLGLTGLFPGYIGPQNLASQSDLLAPHLLYLATWAVSCGLIAFGASRRAETLRLGALLGTGLGAVTFGLFFTDLGEVIAGGSSLLGAGLVLSLLGWLACTAGSLLALTVRSRTAPSGVPAPAATDFPTPPVVTPPPTGAPSPAEAPSPEPSAAGQPFAEYPTGPYAAGPSAAQPYLRGPSFAATPPGSSGRSGRFGWSGPARPRLSDAGPLALVVLAAIGAVAAFAPSWDSYSLNWSVPGISQTITRGNAFANPGVIIFGEVAVMIAVLAVAALAALWRPVRHGALLLTGATVALTGQAISALIQVTQPTPPGQLGISQSTATANGLTISSGLTPIFWVYCVFVISLVVSIAWMLTAPHYPAMPTAAAPTPPPPTDPQQGVDSDTDDSADEDDDAEDDDAQDDGDAEDDAESTYA
jgi:hypothetical protein